MLAQVSRVDRRRFERQWHGLRQKQTDAAKGAPAANKDELVRRIRIAVDRRKQRLARRPRFIFPENLPISARAEEITAAIADHPVVIVAGDTGSGKTTQLPKCCLAAGRGIDGLIGCTQPRRIAAMTVAQRIADELGTPLGEQVGYQIRFRHRMAAEAYIKIMTDGILLMETQKDPWLNAYDTIIVDEAHERSLNIDFILGLLRRLVDRRPDLKLVITSATIDTEKFAAAFGDSPIIQVSGRMFPVDVQYAPPESEDESDTPADAAVAALDRLIRRYPGGGDILTFLPTEQGIREAADTLAGRRHPGITILPLFARLSAKDQSRIFSPARGRKIILATNIAETSLTIPNIQFVVDTGLARISQYLPRTRTTALPIAPISQASADQRMGRCGRVRNGICIRLFSEDDYDQRPRYTLPEILRANLAEVILRMIALKLGAVESFPFIDPPAPHHIRDGLALLTELGAIEPAHAKHPEDMPHRLTGIGRQMARLPVDPRLSRMLVASATTGCLPEMTVLAAVLSIQDPRERPAEKAGAADQAHATFADRMSDFLALLNIWRAFQGHLKSAKSTNAMRRWCRDHFISFRRMREWRDIHRQLSDMLTEQGLGSKDRQTATALAPIESALGDSRHAAIHQAILSGMLANIALQKEGNLYTAARGRQAMIFPGSGLFGKGGRWIVAAEMVETSRLFARTCATIDPRWLEPLGGDLCRHSFSNPHWSRSRGQVVAAEQVTLHGLPIVTNRQTPYGPIAPEESTDIFIRSALVAGDLRSPLPFMTHNRELIDAIQQMEDRIRRRDLLVDDETLVAFYKSHLSGVWDIRTLKRRVKQAGADAFLKLSESDLMQRWPNARELADFPDAVTTGDTELACDYRFDPGHAEDGVTVTIPIAQAARIRDDSVHQWIPGLYRERIAAMIRGLPKALRKRLVPVTDTVAVIVADMPRESIPLETALSRFVFNRFGVDIPATQWAAVSVPDHLKPRMALVDDAGHVVAASREPSTLKVDGGITASSHALSGLKAKWETGPLTDWTIPDLPESISDPDRPAEMAFPALSAESDGVWLRLFTDPDQARMHHRDGTIALLAARLSNDLRFFKKQLAVPKTTKTKFTALGLPADFAAPLAEVTLRHLFRLSIHSRSAFDAAIQEQAPRLIQTGHALQDQAMAVVDALSETMHALGVAATRHRSNAPFQTLVDQIHRHVRGLVPTNFLSLYTPDRWPHLSRYLKADAVRAQRATDDMNKDQAKAMRIQRYTDQLTQAIGDLGEHTSDAKRQALEDAHWLIEELRVSVFAQELGTAVKVSDKRLNKAFDEIKRMV